MPDVAATATAFIRDICAEPEDDGLRLIFADWLEENGQEERAEFIRVQIALANWPCECDSEERVYYPECRCNEKHTLLRRQRELRFAHGADWVRQEIPALTGILLAFGDGEHLESRGAVLCRGFISEITLLCADFLHHAEALFRAAPIARVTLSDKKPAEALFHEMGRYRWWSVNFPLRRSRTNGQDEEPDDIPLCLFNLMRSTKKLDDYVLYFDTREAALIELSTAAVRLGRQRAGLPELIHA